MKERNLDQPLKKCSICGEEYMGFGNNAEPINDGYCCDECNVEVLKERLQSIKIINKMEKIKTPVNMLVTAFGIAFLSGAFEWNLSDDAFILIGLVELVSIIWITKEVYKKQ